MLNKRELSGTGISFGFDMSMNLNKVNVVYDFLMVCVTLYLLRHLHHKGVYCFSIGCLIFKVYILTTDAKMLCLLLSAVRRESLKKNSTQQRESLHQSDMKQQFLIVLSTRGIKSSITNKLTPT